MTFWNGLYVHEKRAFRTVGLSHAAAPTHDLAEHSTKLEGRSVERIPPHQP